MWILKELLKKKFRKLKKIWGNIIFRLLGKNVKF